MANIKIEGLNKVIGKLNSLEKLEAAKAGIKSAALYVKGKVAKYPPRKRVTIAQAGGWASDRQKRWFFAALKAGDIEVPYRRGMSPSSEALGRKWTIQTRNAGLTAVIGNNTSYGPFVMDEDKQSTMHRIIGWKTTQKVAEEESDKVNELLAKAINQALER